MIVRISRPLARSLASSLSCTVMDVDIQDDGGAAPAHTSETDSQEDEPRGQCTMDELQFPMDELEGHEDRDSEDGKQQGEKGKGGGEEDQDKRQHADGWRVEKEGRARGGGADVGRGGGRQDSSVEGGAGGGGEEERAEWTKGWNAFRIKCGDLVLAPGFVNRRTGIEENRAPPGTPST